MNRRPPHIPDIPGAAWDEMPSAYRKADRVEALVRAQAGAVQVLEDHAADLQFSGGWEVAEGDVLDQWGRIVGRQRGPLPDRIFRHLVEGQIQANHSDGTADELVAIYETITDGRQARLWTHPPGGARLEVLRDDWMRDAWAAVVPRVIDQARPAGVEITLIEKIPEGLALSDGEPDLDDDSLLQRTL